MSKRTAQGPQGSKEDENAFAMSSTPDEKPHRATAAQMASRKIKDVRRRPRAGTPTGGAAPPQSSDGAFSSLSSSPAAPAASGFQPTSFNSAPSTGFNFGQSQSQSFPGASSGPTQQTQPTQAASTPFSFGGSGSTGFNFSSSGFGGSAPSSNPFSFNAATSTPQSTPGASTSFGGFGNQPTSQPSFSNGLFGAQQNAGTSASTSAFGGQGSTANSASESMQMSPDAKPKAPSFNANSSATPQNNIFGGSSGTSNLFSSKPATTPSSNPFGGLNIPSATEKPTSDKADDSAAKPAFATQSTPAQPFSGIFGATPAASTPEPAKASTPSIFSSAPATGGNLFAHKPAPSESAKANSSQPSLNNIFSSKPAAETPAPSNPFAPKAASEQNAAAPSNNNSQPFKPLFGNGASSQPTFGNISPAKPANEVTNLFAPKPAADQTSEKPTDPQPFKGLFGGKSMVAQPSEAEKTGSTSFGSLFGTSPAPKSSEPEKAHSTPEPNLFTPKSAGEQEKPAGANPFGSLLGAKSPAPSSSPSKDIQPTPSTGSNLFASKPATSTSQTSGNLFGGNLATSAPKQPRAFLDTYSQSGTATSTDFDPASRLPQSELPASATKEATGKSELFWKVKSLSQFYQKEILKCEAGSDAFDNLVLFYMKARQAMGAPLKPKGGVKFKGNAYSNKPTAHAQNPAVTADANSSNTARLFSQSYSSPSSSPAKPVDAPSQAKYSAAPEPKANPFASLSTETANATPKENLFAMASTGNATTPAEKAPNAASPAAPKLAGNMFASLNPAGAPVTSGVPKFGNGSAGVDFMAQFKKKAEENEAKEKAKRKAEEFDSDEDDEAEWERQDAEKQREKRAKLEGTSMKKSVFVPGEGFKFIDADEPSGSDSGASASQPAEKSPLTAASPAPSTTSIFESSSRPLSNSQNIFGRLSETPQPSDNGKDSDDSDSEAKGSSPKRRASEANGDEDDSSRKDKRTKGSDVAKSSLDTPIPPPTAAAGRSLFDRVDSSAPQQGSTNTSSLFASSFGKPTTTQNLSLGASGLFGSSPGPAAPSFGQTSAPQKEQPPSKSSLFASSPAPTDNTWKPSMPIKFGNDSIASSVPTPASTQASSLGNATSGDATPDEEAAPGAIFDLSSAVNGEQDETVEFECRARAFKLATGWTSQGTGIIKLLKHPDTGRSRIVLRSDPGGNVILNTYLQKELDYAKMNNSVQCMVPQADGKPEHWAIRVKAEFIDGLHNKIEELKN
ncbi:uncharacterized protein N7443_008322 [Penicillium atrosanguineum]|uniref:uncharacterized protein n=1 Tax=Penicillium atrosanguineum TaxID=1132637 RepID=UPI0023A19A96|nr:uncharacterized protein N7443_008322 [Penicillium atrosanguineum]KAJ5292369.1 hypothetical protein N7443_008322 [Penicillium atrosanguineum]